RGAEAEVPADDSGRARVDDRAAAVPHVDDGPERPRHRLEVADTGERPGDVRGSPGPGAFRIAALVDRIARAVAGHIRDQRAVGPSGAVRALGVPLDVEARESPVRRG